MSSPIVLQINRQTEALAGYNGAVTALPQLFLGDSRDFQIGVVDPAQTSLSSASSFIQVILAGYTMYFTVSAQPNGNGTQMIYAGPLAMVWTPAVSAFVGSLNLTQGNLAAAIGANQSAQAWIGIQIKDNLGNIQSIYQSAQPIQIYAPANGNAVVVPQPPVNYLTAQESSQTFVRKDGGNAGDGFFLRSKGGTLRFVSLNDDGTLSIQ